MRRATLFSLLFLAACHREPTVTWSRDVAPVLWKNCAACHRPGEIAPFSLLSYEEAEQRAAQIADVTRIGFMPPWLPEHGFGDFAGERRLTAEQIATLQTWAEEGAPEGDPADLPPPPTWTPGWQLGEPDLVVSMADPYVVPAEGRDVFRNFVLPLPVDERRWVETLEFRSDNPPVVHHVILQVDESGAARRRDAEDPGPGFGGMDLSDSHMPDGQFLGWTPGRVPDRGLPGVAWRLDPGTDLALQLHLTPTGRPEPVTATVGLYYADRPPTRHPFGLMLGSEEIDIPPGVDDYTIRDRFRLPVDVRALGIYPHAHYLGDRMEVWADLPGGEKEWLIKIADWDFNWQDEYRYREPVPLPAGSVIHMLYTYDNSAANPQNPNHPPERVTYGYQSSDEMGYLLLRLLPESRAGRDALHIAQLEHSLEKRPGEWRARGELGRLLLARGDLRRAEMELSRALEEAPPEASELGGILTHLGQVLGRTGRVDEALPLLKRAVDTSPDAPATHTNLGVALLAHGRIGEAEGEFRRALELDPSSPEALLNLARVLGATGRRDEAEEVVRRVLEILPPDSPLAERLRRGRGVGG